MNFDEIYINHLFEKRVMKKTHNKELLHRIYASKYANWIIPYLNDREINEVPILLCCNTLYKLPYFYAIKDKNFFITDYGLYDYIYDLNYTYSNDNRKKHIINIYLKVLIEQLYSKNFIDECYILCCTSPNLEKYKQSSDYHNETIMNALAEKTDLQEAFLLLHEANHFYFKSKNDIKEHPNYKLINSIYSSTKIDITDETFFEECFCDFEAIQYLFEKEYSKTQIDHKEFISLFFKVIIYLYILQSIIFYFNDKNSNPLTMFSMRLNTMYCAIKRYLYNSDFKEDTQLLDNTYSITLTKLIDDSNEAREIVKCLKNELEANKNDFCFNANRNDKIKFIKEYLILE